MRRNLLIAGLIAALTFAGAASAHALLHTIHLNPGACHKVGRVRVCAKRKRPRTRTVVHTVAAPPITVTTVHTVTTTVATPAPSPLSVALEQVRREVAYSENVLGEAGAPYSHGQLVSQAAMDYVVGHVTAPAYGYLELNDLQLPAATPDAALAAQAGICGHAALTFAAIVKRFGFPARSVQFYYGPDGAWNHISVEVGYDGSWHYFDPTFGIEYDEDGTALSIADARSASDPASLLVQDDSLFWMRVVTQAGNEELSDISFATDPDTTVVIDGQPFTG